MKVYIYIYISLLSILYSGNELYAGVRLPKLIGDNMVLQQNTKLKVWGWAEIGESVSVKFNKKKYETKADKDGKWSVNLPSMKAGGPYKMEINDLVISNILIGDVWLCSGQSNMELPINRVLDLYRDEISKTDNPNIRHFKVPLDYKFDSAKEDVNESSWKIAKGDDLLNFSAVAYFYALELYNTYKIPIGLLNASVGGSPAEAWISEEALNEFPYAMRELEKCKMPNYVDSIISSNNKQIGHWYETLNQTDLGYKGNRKWSAFDYEDADWSVMNLPGYWADKGLADINGAVWFRKEIELTKSMLTESAILRLGCIVDADSAFVNGHYVGSVGYQYPPRVYKVPANILQEGKNNITIRVVSNQGRGGFVEGKPFYFSINEKEIPLSGQWKYKVGAEMLPSPSQTFFQYKPTGLYNAMINPLVNYAIKGTIWYQGESNTGNPSNYEKLMIGLMQNWRERWCMPDMPFLYVQLANFMKAYSIPTESKWAELRQAQLNLLKQPQTGMAVTIDLGEWNDIHPLNKKEVGRRLALQARIVAYNQDKIVSSSPIYKEARRKGSDIIVSFSIFGSNLTCNDVLKGFSIAGKDRKYVWADAKIENDKVIISSGNISEPIYIRYAWADNPINANLCSKDGLPASPFAAEIE